MNKKTPLITPTTYALIAGLAALLIAASAMHSLAYIHMSVQITLIILVSLSISA